MNQDPSLLGELLFTGLSVSLIYLFFRYVVPYI